MYHNFEEKAKQKRRIHESLYIMLKQNGIKRSLFVQNGKMGEVAACVVPMLVRTTDTLLYIMYIAGRKHIVPAELERDFYRLPKNNRKIPEDIWNAVGTYRRHLETVGPKLAHYCGYIAGNKLLYRLIPGYCPDPVLTLRYTVMLEETVGEYLKN